MVERIFKRTTRTMNLSRSILTVALTIAFVAPLVSLAQPPQEPIVLGHTEGFVCLAASTVSSIPTSAITGDVGLSPAAGSNITGLTQEEVTGLIYAVDESGPAGSRVAAELLTAAQGDLTAAYNDAAGRTPVPEGNFLDPGTGDIGAMTLEPGLYKFTGAAAITGSDVTLSGGENDVWIFMIASELNVGNGIRVLLTGGARAANIFWQVGTSATLGTTSVFKGTILADQSIAVSTGGTVEGRLLARIAAVTLDQATVTHPGTATSISEIGRTIPGDFALLQNYPNPFNSTTDIGFALAEHSQVRIEVLDILGNSVTTLVNRPMSAGSYTTSWDASRTSSGIYFIRMETKNFNAIRKVTLLR